MIKRIALIIAFIGLLLIAIFYKGFYQSNTNSTPLTAESSPTVDKTNPYVVATNPSPLDQALLLPTQEISISFSDPIENIGELKYRLDPEDQKQNLQFSLSNDRKTVRIKPTPSPWQPGIGYSLKIDVLTKFDGGKRLPNEIIYHFKTIDYSGV